MRKLLLLLFLPVLFCMCLSAQEPSVLALATGTQLPQLPSPLYLDGSSKDLSTLLKSKKAAVLFIWERNQAALGEFHPAANIAARFKDEVLFIAVGIGTPEQLKRFPGAANLGFPVNCDAKGAAKKLLRRAGDTLPLCVVLDSKGVILWRGNIRKIPAVLSLVLKNKYNLSEAIRLEQFSAAVNNAMKNNDTEKALQLLADEYKNNPDKLDLITLQVSLLKKLGRNDDAFKLLHDAETRNPKNYRIFELEYRLIGELDQTAKLPEFFTRVKKAFAAKPDILMAFAVAECKLPPEKLQLQNAIDLAETGWKSNAFKSPEERGLYAMDYASILHNIGRNDLAVKLVESACKDLKGKKTLPKAQQALLYYSKLAEIAPKVALPDLKK